MSTAVSTRASGLTELARAQRTALIAGEQEVARALAREYAPVRVAIERELAQLNSRIDKAIAAGESVSPHVLFEKGRADQMLDELGRRVAAFGRVADAKTRRAAKDSARTGLSDASGLVDAATPEGVRSSFTAARPDALEAAIAQSAAVSAQLPGLGDDERRALRSTLLDNVGRGRHPREAARALAQVTSMPLTRALTVARTEQLRAYRTAAHLTYESHNDALQGWVWLSAADSRTCAACWAMHGSRHPLEEQMASHPNCRCTPIPDVRPWDDLGANGDLTPPLPARGDDLFRRLPGHQQDRILGRAGGKAYRHGEVTLSDFVRRRSHPLYGDSIGRSSLAAARNSASLRTGTEAIERLAPRRSGLDRFTNIAPPRATRPSPSAGGRTLRESLSVDPDFADALAAEKWYGTPASMIDDMHELLDRVLPGLRLQLDQPVRVVEIDPTRLNKFGGVLISQRDPLNRDRLLPRIIELNPQMSGRLMPGTYGHELGHLVDNAATAGVPMTQQPMLAKWRDLVHRTESFAKLPSASTEHGAYLRSTNELWARAFHQYLTTKSPSGSSMRRAWQPALPNKPNHQWTNAEFREIRAEMDAIFVALGWRA